MSWPNTPPPVVLGSGRGGSSMPADEDPGAENRRREKESKEKESSIQELKVDIESSVLTDKER